MNRLLDYARGNRDNRGLMASLRYSLRPTLEHRAWQALGNFGLLRESWDAEAQALVAKLYALHPQETDKGNFGSTCLALCGEGEKPWEPDASPGPMSRRLQRLLAAERPDIGPMLIRLVSYAKNKDIPVNYARLDEDLRHWGENARLRWAAAFWTPVASKENEAATIEEEA
jgi:CRISPR type I-E-associated protein CasB/Cse2